MDGLVDITLSGTVGGSAPFYLSLPFEAPSIALLSDFACIRPWHVMSSNNRWAIKTVFNYQTWGRYLTPIFIALETQLWFQTTCAYLNTKRRQMLLSQRLGIGSKRLFVELLLNLLMALRVAHGIAGDGLGMAMVSPWY